METAVLLRFIVSRKRLHIFNPRVSCRPFEPIMDSWPSAGYSSSVTARGSWTSLNTTMPTPRWSLSVRTRLNFVKDQF